MTEYAPLSLRAGALTLLFEPATASLRYLRFNGRECLRRVYAAVRDHDWHTIEPHVTMLRQEIGPDAFALSFEAIHRHAEVDFVWSGEVVGGADGVVRFSFDGEVRSDFRRNRIGFCVLHPAACAGGPCRVEQVDGSAIEASFPQLIAPHQPFTEIRAITHDVAPGASLEVRMEGDTFEMEDQRNWTDASFKTYCTPLSLPFPVEMTAGTRLRQQVMIRLTGSGAARKVVSAPDAVRAADAPVVLTVAQDALGPAPKLGFGLSGVVGRAGRREGARLGAHLAARLTARLTALRPAHLRVDLRLAEHSVAARLEQAADHGRALGTRLEVALHLGDDADGELKALRHLLDRARPDVARWLVFQRSEKVTSAPWLRLARQHLGPEAVLVGGTDFYFTELNRERPDTTVADAIVYSINPQVHATDGASLVENLAAQGATLRSARSFLAGLPLIVSPVTLRPRSNPDAAEPSKGGVAEGADDGRGRADPRQATLFGATWTLGSFKYLAEGGAHSVTYFETVGPCGLMPDDGTGAVFPVYHVLADLGEFAGADVLRSVSPEPLEVELLALRRAGETRVWLVNHGTRERHVMLRGESASGEGPLRASRVRVLRLEPASVAAACRDPDAYRAQPGEMLATEDGTVQLRLAPGSVVRIADAEPTQ